MFPELAFSFILLLDFIYVLEFFHTASQLGLVASLVLKNLRAGLMSCIFGLFLIVSMSIFLHLP